MRFRFAVALCLVLVSGQVLAAEPMTLKTQKEKLSYSLGLDTGRTMKQSLKDKEFDVDPAILSKGLSDGLMDAKPLMTDEEVKAILTALKKDMEAKQKEQAAKLQEQEKALAEKNKKDGEAFLAENKKKEGVITMPSGLQYKVLTAGKGKSPKATDTVSVHYRVTFIDGRELDSSYKRNQPSTFPVGGSMIKGWTEGLQLMKEGSKYQFFMPAELAYGEQGRQGAILPNSVLIFEVELLSIK